MTNQLGGWSVSWQGVFDAGHVCCMGPPGSDPAGHDGREGHARRTTRTSCWRPTRPRPWRQPPRPTRSWSRSARRPTPRGWATTRQPALPADQQALIARAGGDRQAGDRRGPRRPSARPRHRPTECRRHRHGVPGEHRGGAGCRRRPVRQGQPSGHLPVTLAVGRGDGRRRLRRHAPSPLGDQPKVFDQLPDTGSGPGTRLQPARTRSGSGCRTRRSTCRTCT